MCIQESEGKPWNADLGHHGDCYDSDGCPPEAHIEKLILGVVMLEAGGVFSRSQGLRGGI